MRPDLEPRIREHEAELRSHHPGLSDCDVRVEDRPPRAYERKRYNVRVAVAIRGRQFVVNREHDDDPGVALREAFAAANRQLDALENVGRRGDAG